MGRRADVLRAVRSPRAVLGSLATLDLVRALRLFDEAPEWLKAAIGLLPPFFPLALLQAGVTWSLLFLAFALFAPRLYPRSSGLPRTAPGFRVIVSLSALGIGAALESAPDPVSVLGAAGAFLATCVALVSYLVYRRGWDLLDADDPPVGPIEPFAPFGDAHEEIQRDLRRSGPLGALGASLWVAAFAFVVGFPCFLAGILVLVLRSADPLPDLLVLGWVGVGLVGGASRRISVPDVPDLEGRLFRDVGDSVHGIQGIVVTLFSVLGLLLAAGHVLVVVGVSGATVDLLRLLPYDAVYVSASVAPVICLLAAGCYGLWFWLREFRRIPAFLGAWKGDTGRSAPTRPPGLTLPVAVVAIVPVVLVEWFEAVPWTVPLLGLGWPLLVVGLVVVGRSARRYGRHEFDGEDHAIAVSLAVQVLELWVLGAAGGLGVLFAGRVPPAIADVTWPLVVVLLVLVSLYPNVERYRASTMGLASRYVRSIYLLVLGLFAAVVATTSGPLLAALLGGMAAVCVLGSVGLALTAYADL